MRNHLDKIFSSHKINLLGLSGFKYLILLDLCKEKVDLYLLKSRLKFNLSFKGEENVEICFKETIYNKNPVIIKSRIETILLSKNIKKVLLAVTINDFKVFQLTTSDEIEEEEEWVLTNVEKYLPAATSKEFSFAYQKYFSDEIKQHYVVVLIRNQLNEISEILDSIKGAYFHLITPKLLSILSTDKNLDQNLLLIDRNDKLQFVAIGVNGEFYYEDIYLEDTGIVSNEEADYTFNKEKILEITRRVSPKLFPDESDVQLILNGFSEQDLEDDLNEILNENKHTVKNVSQEKNYLIKKIASGIFENPFQKLNLLKSKTLEDIRDKIEKTIVHKLVLNNFLIVFSVLVTLFIADLFLSHKLNEANDDLIENSGSIVRLQNLKAENESLKRNFRLYQLLRQETRAYSGILKLISEVITPETELSTLHIINADQNNSTIEIEAVSTGKDNAAQFINGLESSSNTSNVKLNYLSKIDRKQNKSDRRLNLNSGFEFKLTLNYAID